MATAILGSDALLQVLQRQRLLLQLRQRRANINSLSAVLHPRRPIMSSICPVTAGSPNLPVPAWSLPAPPWLPVLRTIPPHRPGPPSFSLFHLHSTTLLDFLYQFQGHLKSSLCVNDFFYIPCFIFPCCAFVQFLLHYLHCNLVSLHKPFLLPSQLMITYTFPSRSLIYVIKPSVLV